MNLALTVALLFIALGWLFQSLRAWIGMTRLPRLADVDVKQLESCPKVSLLFAARDEAKCLPRALKTFQSQEYGNLEIIAVDDRSSDETAAILDQAGNADERLLVEHVSRLPTGWLGKPHALEQAYQRSSGEWLVFTDADVRMAPDVIQRALALAEREHFDHLTLLGKVDMFGFWERVALTFFGVGFVFFSEAWKVSNPRSRAYCGVGAFQLIRRSTYEAIGTHRRLAMEVIDDMKLGKLVKMGGFRSGVGLAEDAVTVRWYAGLGNIIRGTTKNLFAGAEYSPIKALLQLVMLFAFDILPYIAPLFASRTGTVLALLSVLMGWVTLGGAAHNAGVSVFYGLTNPLGAAITAYMISRSMFVTLRQGGVTWRGTFYPLKELKKGLV